MAHTKSQGAAKRTVNVAGKRLGVKKFGGEHVIPGNIIIRQRGSTFHPGKGTMMGKDFTIFATVTGFVSFRNMTGIKRTQKYVDVVAAVSAAEPVKAEAKTTKTVSAKPKAAAKSKSAKKATK